MFFLSSNTQYLYLCVFLFCFTVRLHPVLHGHRGPCFIHSLPAYFSGHLLLLQVKDLMWWIFPTCETAALWECNCSLMTQWWLIGGVVILNDSSSLPDMIWQAQWCCPYSLLARFLSLPYLESAKYETDCNKNIIPCHKLMQSINLTLQFLLHYSHTRKNSGWRCVITTIIRTIYNELVVFEDHSQSVAIFKGTLLHQNGEKVALKQSQYAISLWLSSVKLAIKCNLFGIIWWFTVINWQKL